MSDVAAEKLTAADVREGLRKRWPDSEYLTITEAPETADRMGRKLDMVVASLWRSRGYELDGVEIKVSVSDWKREVVNARKADFWFKHVHRFWVAVPVAIAPKVREDLPTGWGLLAVQGGASKEVVKATKHEPEPIGWGTAIGMMRAACNAGVGVISRAENRGRAQALEQARAEASRVTGDEALRRQLADLRAKVSAFKEASGIDVANGFGVYDATQLGHFTAIAEKILQDPSATSDRFTRLARDLQRDSERFAGLAAAITAEIAPDAEG